MPRVPTVSPSVAPSGPQGIRVNPTLMGGIDTPRTGRAPQAATPQTQAFDMPGAFKATRTELSTPQVSQFLRTAMTPEMLAIPGQQIAQAGRAISDAAGVAGKIALDIQNDVNQVSVRDAVNRARSAQMQLTHAEGGYTSVRGGAVDARPSGKPLSDEYLEKYDESLTTIQGNLKNDAQRQAFQTYAQELRMQFQGNVSKYEMDQRRDYALSVAKGTISLETEAMVANRNDPIALENSVAQIRSAAADIGYRQGMSPEEIEGMAAQAVSGAHKAVLQDALDREDMVFADAYIKQHKNSISASVLMGTRTAMAKQVDTMVAVDIVGQTYAGVQAAGTTDEFGRFNNITAATDPDFGKMTNITLISEGGGTLQNEKVSPKRAKGPMQVMPDTQRDPGYGVRPARNDSAEERARVGRDYLAAMLRTYDGDPAKAWAAYNDGPGDLDKLLKKHGNNWLAHAPQETREYVIKNMKMLDGDGTSDAAPTAGTFRKPTYEEGLNAVLNHPEVKFSPRRRREAQQEWDRVWNAGEKSRKAAQDDGLDAAYQWLEQNGGNFAAMPPTIKRAIDPSSLDSVRSFATTLAKGDDVETDIELYESLRTNPDLLAKTKISAFRNKLSKSDMASLISQQANLNGGADGKDRYTRLASANEVFDNNVRSVGLDPNPKDQKEAVKVKAIRQRFQAQLQAVENGKGKPLTPTEVEAEAARFFTTVDIKGGWGGQKRIVGMLGEGDEVVIKPAERAQIIEGLRANKRPVNEQSILDAFLRNKTRG